MRATKTMRMSKASSQMDEFYSLLHKVKTNPTLDASHTLTEWVAQHPDLREDEQSACFREIEAFSATNTKDPHTLDEADLNLVRLVTGVSNVASVRMDALYHLVRTCLGALVTGDDAHLKSSYFKALGVIGKDKLKDDITMNDVVELLYLAHELPANSRKASEHQLKPLISAFGEPARQKGLVIDEVYEILEHDNQGFWKKKELTALFCHCSKTQGAIGSIVSEGLRVKGSSGRLGAAIYMSDEITKALQYSTTSVLADGNAYGVVFIVEAALGKTFETKKSLSVLRKGFVFTPNLSSRRLKTQRLDTIPYLP